MKIAKNSLFVMLVFVLSFSFAPAAVFTADIPADGNVLLIQDNPPWTFRSNETVLDKIGASYDLVSASVAETVDFNEYDVIIVANSQIARFYPSTLAMTPKFEQYVTDGGVLLYGDCAQFSSYVAGARPGGVKTVYYADAQNYIADPDHLIVAGALTEDGPLTDAMLNGDNCSHTYFDPATLPEGTNVIFRDSRNNPTLIEFQIGKGAAVLSGLTWEFYYELATESEGVFAKVAMEDYFRYGLALASGLPESLTLSQTAAEMIVGETLQLTAEVFPADVFLNAVTWESSDPAVATVSENGLVTAISQGEATVTAKTGIGLTATCAVTVGEKHTVTFVDHDGTVLNSQDVGHGAAAVAPADPVRTGYTFTGWDQDFSSVTNDLTVTATYAPLFSADFEGVISASVANASDAVLEGMTIAAVYDGAGAFVTADAVPFQVAKGKIIETEFDIDPNDYPKNEFVIKVFFWNNGFVPLTTAIER